MLKNKTILAPMISLWQFNKKEHINQSSFEIDVKFTFSYDQDPCINKWNNDFRLFLLFVCRILNRMLFKTFHITLGNIKFFLKKKKETQINRFGKKFSRINNKIFHGVRHCKIQIRKKKKKIHLKVSFIFVDSCSWNFSLENSSVLSIVY